jgi:hypothetical protein
MSQRHFSTGLEIYFTLSVVGLAVGIHVAVGVAVAVASRRDSPNSLQTSYDHYLSCGELAQEWPEAVFLVVYYPSMNKL